MTDLSEQDVMAKIGALGEITEGQRNSIVCSLIGHSRIVTTCFGYIYCARCDAQIGDSLGGSGSTATNVIVGHNCPTCRENFAAATWKDTLFAPDPFAESAS